MSNWKPPTFFSSVIKTKQYYFDTYYYIATKESVLLWASEVLRAAAASSSAVRGDAAAGDSGGSSGAREARRGPWRGSVAVALRKVESGARAEWPQYPGFKRSVTVQRVSVLLPARPASYLMFAPARPPHCTLCELRTFPFLWHSTTFMYLPISSKNTFATRSRY